MKGFINNISHYGDIAAIPFFALLVAYFYTIEDKTSIEYLLFGFSLTGLVVDILFTYRFVYHNP